MAITELIFGKPTRAKIGTVTMDCSVSETHLDEVEITDHPVEVGSDISDHIRKRPVSLELNGIVTNTPVVFLASLLAESPLDYDFAPSFDRVNTAYEELRRIQSDGDLVDVVTSLREYKNMAIQSLSVSRDAATGNVLNATISLREVALAKSLAVDLPVPEAVQNLAKKSKGKVPKSESSAAQGVKSQSILSQLSGSIGGLFGV